MTTAEVDEYIAAAGEPQRKVLLALREVILQYLPAAEQVISYGMPGFRVNGKVIAGMAGHRNFVSYYPHSGSVIAQVPAAAGYESSAGSLHLPLDKPVPKRLVKQLIQAKLAQIESGA